MVTAQPGDLPDVLVRELMHHYMIPQTGIRIWGAAQAFSALAFAQPVSDDVKVFTASLSSPYCGVNSGFEAAQWLEEPASAKSMALVPLRADLATTGGAFGMLVLASPDPTRYTAEMGTEFLERIGEIASAALSRVLPARG
jgi:uncharacterized protein YigA (DUF484 family)